MMHGLLERHLRLSGEQDGISPIHWLGALPAFLFIGIDQYTEACWERLLSGVRVHEGEAPPISSLPIPS